MEHAATGVLDRGGYRTTIKAWPAGERPREKLTQQGAPSLSEAELVAIALRTGVRGATALDVARKLLREGKGLRGLSELTVGDLCAFGIGKARAATLVAVFEIARRLPLSEGPDRPAIHTPEDVARRFLPRLQSLKHEEFWSLLLNSANRLIKEVRVTSGTLNASLVDPRECFYSAVREKAASLIVVHNHPSGNAEPSAEDVNLTRQLVEAGKIMGIPVHDHVIIAGSGYTSLAERNLL